jgi:hypothetical protein
MIGVTFDAGGLIALDRGDRRVVALVARAAERGAVVTVPATALAQAVRRPAKQPPVEPRTFATRTSSSARAATHSRSSRAIRMTLPDSILKRA